MPPARAGVVGHDGSRQDVAGVAAFLYPPSPEGIGAPLFTKDRPSPGSGAPRVWEGTAPAGASSA